MDPRVSFITLAVPDLEAARAFYVDGLGWEAAIEVAGRRADDPGRRQAGALAVGRGRVRGRGRPDPPRRRPRRRSRWPTTCPPARRSTPSSSRPARPGRRTSANAEEREWGGYTGYFADPAGFRWEVAYEPRPHRTDSAALTRTNDHDDTSRPDPAARALADWVLHRPRPRGEVRDRRLRHGPRARRPHRRRRRGGRPPPRRDADLADGAGPAVEPRLRGVTERDVALARRDQRDRRASSASPRPRRKTQNLELCLDTADTRRRRPFWAAVLGYDWDEEHARDRRPRRPDAHDVVPADRRARRAAPALARRHPRRPGRSPTSASTRRWPRAARWSATRRRRRSRSWPTRRATRSASAPGSRATPQPIAYRQHPGRRSRMLGRVARLG